MDSGNFARTQLNFANCLWIIKVSKLLCIFLLFVLFKEISFRSNSKVILVNSVSIFHL
jgi:hypothetical protein